ncbi:MAG: F0F1 ATP synthase subunit delta [Gammaproteobacteria bacterium]|nr:F0F1 ATP synthase subunit delta [Gammaproteobacteria bacterium]
MSDMTTGARPYAKAVFELTSDESTRALWSDALQLLTMIVSDDAMKVVLDAPHYTKEQRAELVLSVAEGKLEVQAQSLIRLLAENDRLQLLPTIAQLFETYCAEADGAQDVRVVSARKLTKKQEAALVASLEGRFGNKVTTVYEVDAALLGGAVIYAGDLVIDGSVKGKMSKLARTVLRK